VRAACCGGAIGSFAAVFKLLLRATASAGSAAENLAAHVPEIAGASLAFALLCAGAAALRNFVARRLNRPQTE
jgi:hypothetical protein